MASAAASRRRASTPHLFLFPHVPAYRVYGFGFQSDFRFQARLPFDPGPPLGSFTLRPELVEAAPQGPPDYRGHICSEGSEPYLVAWRTQGEHWLKFSGIGIIRVMGADVEACSAAEADPARLEIPFLSTVMSVVAESRGQIMLHAAGARIGDRVIGLIGGSRSGKSTLLSALLTSGLPLVSDDLLPISCEGDTVIAESGYPQVRLWPEQARHFLGRDDFPYVAPYYPKCRVPVGKGGFGAFSDGTLPVSALYLLERSDSGAEDQPRLERLSPAEAAVELLRHSFIYRLANLVAAPQERFERVCDIAGRVPMMRLHYPSGLDRLDDVIQTIQNDAVSQGRADPHTVSSPASISAFFRSV